MALEGNYIDRLRQYRFIEKIRLVENDYADRVAFFSQLRRQDAALPLCPPLPERLDQQKYSQAAATHLSGHECFLPAIIA